MAINYVFPTFQDLKKKDGASGGFSDGGILCGGSTLLLGTPVTIGPVAGVSLGGIALNAQQFTGTVGTQEILNVSAVGSPFALSGDPESLDVKTNFPAQTAIILGGSFSGVTCWNFDPGISCHVGEYLVLADGTEVYIGNTVVAPLGHQNVSSVLAKGSIVSYPNKLRYKMRSPGGEEPVYPEERILIKWAVHEYDLPWSSVPTQRPVPV